MYFTTNVTSMSFTVFTAHNIDDIYTIIYIRLPTGAKLILKAETLKFQILNGSNLYKFVVIRVCFPIFLRLYIH